MSVLRGMGLPKNGTTLNPYMILVVFCNHQAVAVMYHVATPSERTVTLAY